MKKLLFVMLLAVSGCERRVAPEEVHVVRNPDGFSVGFEFRTSNGALCVADWSMDSVTCDWDHR